MIFDSIIVPRIIVVLISVLLSKGFSQNNFSIENENGYFKQKFELANDLVIIPVELNGRELSFLLDTGVSSTILFSFLDTDSTSVNNPSVIYLKGLGSGKPLRALKSENNILKIGDAVSRDQDIYILEGEIFSISNRLGVALNGILGYDFFKDFVVEMNYKRKKMKVFEKGVYEYDKCRRCVDLPLEFYRDKPYVKAEVSLNGKNMRMVDLLVDSGSGDALWLFKDPENGLVLPEKSFEDFLGFGITGSVYGDRSRIESLALGKYELNKVTVSYPDSISLASVNSFEERDGSLGAQVLKRFHSVFDFKGKNLRLKPNNDFSDPFEYNMSGIVVQHNGYKIVENETFTGDKPEDDLNESAGKTIYAIKRKIFYSLEPSYEIAEIRPDSPAEIAGLQVGDEVVLLNGRPVYRYNLEKITEILSSKEGKRIRLEVLRKGRPIEIEFTLERIL